MGFYWGCVLHPATHEQPIVGAPCRRPAKLRRRRRAVSPRRNFPSVVIAGLDPAIHDASQPMQTYFVYILTNVPRGTLYVGVTNALVRRIYEHREGAARGFTKRYELKMLVHFECYDEPTTAIQREKNIKHWSRVWKLKLVETSNPQWRDLYNDITR
jgi:putative endonuclease